MLERRLTRSIVVTTSLSLSSRAQICEKHSQFNKNYEFFVSRMLCSIQYDLTNHCNKRLEFTRNKTNTVLHIIISLHYDTTEAIYIYIYTCILRSTCTIMYVIYSILVIE